MEMQKMEQSQNSLERLRKSVDELIEVVHKQQNDFAQRLQAEQGKTALEGAKAEVLSSENEKLKAELEAAKNNTENETRMQQMQNEIENKASKISNLQNEDKEKNSEAEDKIKEIKELGNTAVTNINKDIVVLSISCGIICSYLVAFV